MKRSFYHKLIGWLGIAKTESVPCVKKIKAGMFSFQVVDADTGEPLQGAEFTMYCEGEAIITSTSDSNGTVFFPCIYPGVYSLEETRPPEGYQPKKMKYEVVVDVLCMVTIGDMMAGMFKVLSKKTVVPRIPFVLFKLDGRNGEGVEGARFRLYNDVFDRTEVSGDDGELDYGRLAPGTYKLCEVEAPIGYMALTNEYEVNVKPDGSIRINGVPVEEFRLTNTVCTGFGIFRRTKDGAPIRGTVFELRQYGEALQTATTNQDGYASFECFPPGRYTLVETMVPVGYEADEKEHDVISGYDGKITIDGKETFEWELLA